MDPAFEPQSESNQAGAAGSRGPDRIRINRQDSDDRPVDPVGGIGSRGDAASKDPVFGSNLASSLGSLPGSPGDVPRPPMPAAPALSRGLHDSELPGRATSLRPPSVGVQVPETAHSAGSVPVQAPPAGRGAFYFMLTVMLSVFAVWFVGPRLVEEYHYAATVGQSRAEYDYAVAQLDKAPLTEVSLAYKLVAQRIRPSVVSINANKSREDGSGLGSGVILSTEGHIMTNAHVVKDANEYIVELFNHRRYRAVLLGIDATSDLAVLKIEAPDLVPASWGDSDSLDVGSIVWAIGSPYGFQQTITSGILSGKDRPGDPRHQKQTLLQTDAAVNPGNSGGPLVDAQGLVIGINTSIFGETFQGISFAVPSSTARFVFGQIVASGNVTRGFLGVEPAQVRERDARRINLPDLEGARLETVQPNSPAAVAGIRRGDVIRRWNGRPIENYRQLFRLSESTPPYTEVELTLFRDGVEAKARVTLGEFPQADQSYLTPSEFYRKFK